MIEDFETGQNVTNDTAKGRLSKLDHTKPWDMSNFDNQQDKTKEIFRPSLMNDSVSKYIDLPENDFPEDSIIGQDKNPEIFNSEISGGTMGASIQNPNRLSEIGKIGGMYEVVQASYAPPNVSLASKEQL